jgi:hypothetical protein
MREVKYISAKPYWCPIIVRRKQYYLYVDGCMGWDGCSKVVDSCNFASFIHDFLFARNKAGKYLVATSVNNIRDNVTEWISINIQEANLIYSYYQPTKLKKIIRYLGLQIFGRFFYQRKDSVIIYVDKRMFKDLPEYKCSHGHKVIYKDGAGNISIEVFGFYKV